MIASIRTFFRFILVLSLAGILFAYAMFQGGFVSWFLFFGFLPVFLYSLFLTFYPLSLFKAERQFNSSYGEAGQDIQVEVTLKRFLPLPVFYLIIEDSLPESLNWKDTRAKKYQFLSKPKVLMNREAKKTIIFPWFKRRLTYHYLLDHVPRGKHEFSAVKIVTGDFLGIIKKRKVIEVQNDFAVRAWNRTTKLSSGMSAFDEGRQSAFLPQVRHTNVVSGVRDYAPGDRISWVDWKTTAKKQRLVTKEFEQEKNKDVTVLLNGAVADPNRWLAFEAAIELSQSLARQSLNLYGNVQFIHAGALREELMLSNRRRCDEQLIHLLSTIQPLQSSSFEEQLIKEASLRAADRNLLIVSAELNEQIGESVLRLSQQARDVLFIFIAGKKQLTDQEHAIINRLAQSPAGFQWLSEDNLTSEIIEVNA
ncbi:MULTISPECIES: DUF58 domain-containing protein [Allobacillus]|uniref:DUF58 domain-containing protein n=1 Tax=Allobacillus salarius TaxID=1955272 RepID=A0A556PGS0_9BACI|nr:DUF58 domain-containing protein [Allobacillus salarius]TSJ63578.1 DUF58 domain-containing protein [Allobacillus salarius]